MVRSPPHLSIHQSDGISPEPIKSKPDGSGTNATLNVFSIDSREEELCRFNVIACSMMRLCVRQKIATADSGSRLSLFERSQLPVFVVFEIVCCQSISDGKFVWGPD